MQCPLSQYNYVLLFSPQNWQAFSSHVFYNADTGLFEQVQGAGEGGMVWGSGGVMSSASTDTLYLTDDAVGPVSE